MRLVKYLETGSDLPPTVYRHCGPGLILCRSFNDLEAKIGCNDGKDKGPVSSQRLFAKFEPLPGQDWLDTTYDAPTVKIAASPILRFDEMCNSEMKRSGITKM